MPYRSDAQRRWFNANRKMLTRRGVDVDEWNSSSRGKKLPERVAEKQAAASTRRDEPDRPLKSTLPWLGLGLGGAGVASYGLASGLASDRQVADVVKALADYKPEAFTNPAANAPGHTGLSHYATTLSPAASLRPFGVPVGDILTTLRSDPDVLEAFGIGSEYGLFTPERRLSTGGAPHYRSYSRGPVGAYAHQLLGRFSGQQVPPELAGGPGRDYSSWMGDKLHKFIASRTHGNHPLELDTRDWDQATQSKLLSEFGQSLSPAEQAYRHTIETPPPSNLKGQADNYTGFAKTFLKLRRGLQDAGITLGGAGVGAAIGHMLYEALQDRKDRKKTRAGRALAAIGGAGVGGVGTYFLGTQGGRDMLGQGLRGVKRLALGLPFVKAATVDVPAATLFGAAIGKLAAANESDDRPPARTIVDMRSPLGAAADYLTPVTWGGERAGRAETLARAVGATTPFSVRHPFTSSLLHVLGGAAVGGLGGALAGAARYRNTAPYDAVPNIAAIAGLGAVGGGWLGGAAAGWRRRNAMNRIVEQYEAARKQRAVSPKPPELSSVSMFAAPYRGAHRTGQVEAYRRLQDPGAPVGSLSRSLLYGLAQAAPVAGVPASGVLLNLAHMYGQNIDTQAAGNALQRARPDASRNAPDADSTEPSAPGVKVANSPVSAAIRAVTAIPGQIAGGLQSAATTVRDAVLAPRPTGLDILGGMTLGGAAGLAASYLQPKEERTTLDNAIMGAMLGGVGGAGLSYYKSPATFAQPPRVAGPQPGSMLHELRNPVDDATGLTRAELEAISNRLLSSRRRIDTMQTETEAIRRELTEYLDGRSDLRVRESPAPGAQRLAPLR